MARSLISACRSSMFWKSLATALMFPVVIVMFNAICQGIYRATVPVKNVAESSPVDPEAGKQIGEIRDSTLINISTQEYSQIQATHCYVVMTPPPDHHEGKECRMTPRVQEIPCVALLENGSKQHTCCDVAEWCNNEKYCVHGKMMCLSKRGLEHPTCVCQKGWHGPRCDQCSQRFQVPCMSYDGYPDLMPCSSNDADPGGPCWTTHRINGQNYTLFCEKAKDGQAFIPDTRCSGDRTDLCVEDVGSDNRSAEEEKADRTEPDEQKNLKLINEGQSFSLKAHKFCLQLLTIETYIIYWQIDM